MPLAASRVQSHLKVQHVQRSDMRSAVCLSAALSLSLSLLHTFSLSFFLASSVYVCVCCFGVLACPFCATFTVYSAKSAGQHTHALETLTHTHMLLLKGLSGRGRQTLRKLKLNAAAIATGFAFN